MPILFFVDDGLAFTTPGGPVVCCESINAAAFKMRSNEFALERKVSFSSSVGAVKSGMDIDLKFEGFLTANTKCGRFVKVLLVLSCFEVEAVLFPDRERVNGGVERPCILK